MPKQPIELLLVKMELMSKTFLHCVTLNTTYPLCHSLSYCPYSLGNGCAQFESPSLLSQLPPPPKYHIHMFGHQDKSPKNSSHALALITLPSL